MKWKKASRKFRKHVNDWKNTFRIAQSLKVKRKGTKISEIKIQSLINQAKEGLEENQYWLSQYEYNVVAPGPCQFCKVLDLKYPLPKSILFCFADRCTFLAHPPYLTPIRARAITL